MTNIEAKNALKRLIVELEILNSGDFNAEKKENMGKALTLLRDVSVWAYED